MTDIPGTSSPKKPVTATLPPVPSVPQAKAAPDETIMSVTNVSDLTSKAAQKVEPTASTTPTIPEPWYNTLYAWMGYGTIVGAVFVILGILHHQFYALAPIGPTLATVLWFIRSYVKKHSKNVDVFS
jgi:hypothetical protein